MERLRKAGINQWRVVDLKSGPRCPSVCAAPGRSKTHTKRVMYSYVKRFARRFRHG